MNQQREKYQEAVKRLPEIEEQIVKIMQFKKELALGNISEIKINMQGNTKQDRKEDNTGIDISIGTVSWFEMMRRMSFPVDLPKLSADPKGKTYTGEIEINEILSNGICEAMLQILTEERNILIARIKSFV